ARSRRCPWLPPAKDGNRPPLKTPFVYHRGEPGATFLGVGSAVRYERRRVRCADQDVHRTRVHAAYILTRRVSEETASIQRRHTFPHLHFGVMTLVRQVYQLHTAHRAVARA